MSTPTPTDPREDIYNTYASMFGGMDLVVPLDVARNIIDGLTSELATAREERDAAVAKASNLFDGSVVLGADNETLQAELEAARKELESEREDKQTAIDLVNERGDKMQAAFAAKDAAEKTRDEADRRAGAAERRLDSMADALIRHDRWNRAAKEAAGYHPNVSFDVVWDEALAALIEKRGKYPADENKRALGWVKEITSAPTQEPPAGGVTISNDSSGETGRRTSNEADRLARADNSMGVQVPPAITPPTSPADVPSEGRGELLPFNLSDALAGKPVVTRDGSWRGTLVAAPNLDADIIGDYVAIAVMTAGPFLVLRDGRLFNDRLNDKDLFMLPTEGSGA